MYIAGVGKRKDSWAGVAIYRTAKKAISYSYPAVKDKARETFAKSLKIKGDQPLVTSVIERIDK